MKPIDLNHMQGCASFHDTLTLCSEATKRGVPCSMTILGCTLIAEHGDCPHKLYALILASDQRAIGMELRLPRVST